MTAVELRDYCFSPPGINGKPISVPLKRDPVLARDLRAAYDAISPGYHMNNEHWNTVRTGSDLPEERLRWLIDHSHQLVAAGLPRSRRPAGGGAPATKAPNGSSDLPDSATH